MAEEYVCDCMGVTREDIEKAIKAGAKDFDAVQEETEAGMGCGGCQEDVEAIIDELVK
jgi:bacterioferritin-associated ferredoxin